PQRWLDFRLETVALVVESRRTIPGTNLGFGRLRHTQLCPAGVDKGRILCRHEEGHSAAGRLVMKRIFLIVLIAAGFSVGGASAQTADAPQAPHARRKLVAVFDFDYATVQSSSAAVFGNNVDIGKGIADLLVRNLVKDGTYRVI